VHSAFLFRPLFISIFSVQFSVSVSDAVCSFAFRFCVCAFFITALTVTTTVECVPQKACVGVWHATMGALDSRQWHSALHWWWCCPRGPLCAQVCVKTCHCFFVVFYFVMILRLLPPLPIDISPNGGTHKMWHSVLVPHIGVLPSVEPNTTKNSAIKGSKMCSRINIKCRTCCRTS